MKLTKRLLATLLTVVMVLTMLPAIALTASAADTTETLTASDFAATGTSYAASSGVSKGGTARYAAYTAKNGSNIQFNKKQNCYIVSTTSGGKVKSVTVTIASGTQAIIVKGSNTAYTTSNAYSNGTEIARGTSTFTATPTTDYEYFAIVGNANGAVYISKVEVTWTSGASYTLSAESNNTSWGTVGTPSNGTVACTPATGYYVASASVTANCGLTVAVSGNNVTYSGTQTKDAVITVTFAARSTHTLTYSANGATTDTTQYDGDTITLPSSPSTTPSGYTFMGWLPNTYATNDTAPTGLIAPGGSYTMPASNTTLYAVYAISGGSSSKYELTDSFADGEKFIIASSNAAGSAYALDTTVLGGTATSSMASATTGVAGAAVTINSGSPNYIAVPDNNNLVFDVEASGSGYILKFASDNSKHFYLASSYIGYNNASNGTNIVGYSSEYTHLTRPDASTVNLGFNSSTHYFYKVAATTAGSVYLYKLTSGSSYSGYTTSPKTLSSIALSGTYPTTFTQGDAFSSSGIVVTATYSDSSTANVTSSATFSGYNMSNTGSQTVTVTYVEGGVTRTATYTITVNAAVTYNITLSQTTGGTISSSSTLTGLNSGATAVISAAPATGYQLDSWTVSGTGSSYTGTNPITVTVGTAPVTVSATFSKINYTITYESAPSGGSIGIAKRSTQTLTANYGDTIDVTVTPDSDHGVGTSITVTDTTNNVAVSTTQSGNVFTFTMPAGNVTVASNANTFTVLPTYTATFTANGDELTTLEDSGHEGNTITLPTLAQMTALGLDEINYFDGSSNTTFTFAGWAPVSAISTPTGTQPTGYVAAGGTYTFGAADVDFRAIYVNGSGGNGFTLSYTYSGTTYYAGLYGSNILAAETNAANAATYYIEDGTYLYFMNGETKTYVNHTGSSSTNLSTSTSTKQAWTITESDGTIVFQSTANTGRHLSFNYNNGNPRFNAVSGGSAYTLTKSGSGSYLTEETVAGNACTVTFYGTDNTTVLQTGTVYEGNVPAFTGTTPTKDPSGIYYYTFAGWNTSANQSSTVTITAIGSSESTRSYYPVFTENTATFTLNLSGRTKVSTEGSFQSTVLTPSLTTEQTGCSATISSISATYTSGSASIATFTTTGNVLTVTGVAAGNVTLNVTATYDDGHTATKSVTVQVIAGSGAPAGGYKLMTQENTYTDSSDVDNYDWSGEYIFAARTNGTASNINSLYILTPSWSGDTATLPDSSANAVLYTFDPDEADDFGATSAQNGTITASVLHSGEADYVEGATATADGYVFDRITGFTDGSNNDITDHYVFVFERVDEINNYYTIRIKGTNYYLENSSTANSGNNHLGGLATATADAEQSDDLMWHIRWASSGVDAIDGLSSVTPDMVLIESVTALDAGVSRAPLFNQSAQMFRTYGSGAYGSQLNNSGGGYNLFLYGKQIPFESEIIYDDVERNTTNAKIEVPYNYATMTNSDTLLLEGLLDPESYPNWTVLNSGIPTWTLVGAYNSDNSSFTPSASVSAITGTQNAEFHVASWSASDIGKYYVVKINYQVQDPDGVTHDVPQQAMIVVVDADLTFNTIINEASSLDHTGSWTVPSRDGVSGVDLNAFVVDNYGTQYSQRSIPEGYELTQPSSWTYTSQRGYTYSIDSAGVVTWTPANILKDDVVVITATAVLTENGVAQTVNAGTFTLYVNKLAYTAEVQDANNSSNTTIPYAETAFAVTLGNFANNNGDAPGSSTYDINSATEWNWTAVKESDGTAVSITGTSTGATINVTGLDAGTRIIVRATNVIATSNTTAGVHTVVTVAGKVFTVGEDDSLAAVDDSFVLDFDRDAVLNVMANDRNTDGATISAIGGTNVSMAAIGTGANAGKIVFTVPEGQLRSTYTFTYTLSKSGETDSTATVTVKPASAVYYEDNNDGFFTYTDGTKGKWSEEGADSGWLQDASAAAEGYDAANSSLTWSAGVYHKANVGKTTDYGTAGASETWPKMEFTFVGNAFSISMMRNNYTGLIAVYVDGTKVKNVATAYGASGGEYDPEADHGGFIYESGDSNYGMPAFYWASSNTAADTHTVKVQVLYSGMYDHNDPKANNYDVYIDGVTIYNPIEGSTAYKYISFRDTVLAAGSLGIPTTQPHNYAATLTPASQSIGSGLTGELQVSLTDEGAPVNTGYSVAYSSSDTSIATVNASGLLNTTTGVNTTTVTGVSAGTATITATITTPAGTTITRTATVTVSETVYTVTYVLPNGEQEVVYADSTISLGSGVTHLTAAELAEYDAHNYSFRGWLNEALVTDTDTMPALLRDNGASVTLTGDATYYAVYRYGTTENDFVLKTDLTNPLVDGDTILIYETEGSGNKYVLSNQNYGSSGWQLNYRSAEAAVPTLNMITKSNTELYWNVVATTGGFYLMDKDGNYLSATNNDGELVVLSSPDSAKSVWNATTTGVSGANSVFIYTNQSTPQYLQHYSGYPEFCCYTWDEAYSNKNEMQIYVQAELANYYATTLTSNTPIYQVTYKVNGVTVSTESVRSDSDPSFAAPAAGSYSSYDAHDYRFLGWIPTTIATDTTTAPATIYEAGDSYTLSAATTFHAVFSYTGAGSASGYALSSSAPADGDTVILALKSGDDYYALPHGTTSSSSWSGTAITLTNGVVSSPDDLLWTAEDTNNSDYPVKFTYGNSKFFKLNSSQLAYTGNGDTGYMKFTASGSGFTMENNTPRYLAQSGTSFGVTSDSESAATVYVFKYSTSAGGSTMYATTLAASTHSYAATVSPSSLSLAVNGATGTVTGSLTDNGNPVASGWTVSYSSSATGVATVNASTGVVTPVAAGNATITATVSYNGNDYTATCPVVVAAAPSSYTVTYMVNGSQYGETEPVVQGNSPSFTAPSYDVSGYNAHAYEFLGWKEGSALNADTTEAQTLYVAGNTHEISANTTYYAVYRYTEGGSATTTIDNLANGGSGTYVIAANVGGTYYALPNSFTLASGKISGTQIATPGSTMTTSEASGYAVTIAKDSSGNVTISNGTDYLTYSSSTNLGTSSSAYNWTIGSGTKGSYRVNSGTSGRGLVYRASTYNVFGGYSTGNITANGTEYYDVEIIPVGSSGTTYYATTLNVASAHTYVASISPSTLTLTAGNDSSVTGTLTDNGITTTSYTPAYTSSDSSVVTVDTNGYVSAEAAGTATITVTYTVDGTPYTATCSVTVNAVNTEYAASYAVQSGVTYSGNSRSGNTITLPAAVSIPASYDAHSYTLVGWATETGADDTTKPTCYDPGEQVTITDDTTFYPVYSYSVGGGASTYNRITSTSDLTSGAKYLIVSEDGNRVMKSSNSSNTLANTYDTLTLDGSGTVTATTTLNGYAYTYQNSGFYGTNERYIYGTSGSNALNFSTSAQALTISFSGNNAVITSNTSVLRDNTGFRFYKAASSGTGNPVQLYKYTAGSGGGTLTYTFTLAAASATDNYVGTVTATPSSVNLGGSTAALSSTLTNNGETVSSGNYSVSYAVTSGSAATVSGSTLTSGSSAGSVTVTATFTVGGSTVATATCNVSVVDPNASVTVNYVGGSTGYVYNWGTRDTTATFLTAPTSSYYTGSYSYATLSALTGSSTATAAAIYQSDLGTAIHNMLVAKQSSTTTYDGTKTLYKYTDCVGSNTSNMSSFYSGTTITNTWDSGSTWNREHTWPNSKGLNSSDENDIMMLRPTSVSENSSRGNTAYGSSGSYYDPNQHGQNLHGDIARLMLQHLMRWGNTSAFYGTSGVIESRAVLLQWLAEDPVDTWELGRNDAVQRITGVRNVFVDYPELAFILLGASVPSNYTTPSSSGIVAGATYNNTYGGSYQPVTNTSRIANPGVEYAVMDTEPVTETRSATRAVGDENASLPVAGAVMLDGIGQITNNDDVMSYLASYGAQNCLVVPANGAIVFYLTGGSTVPEISIGASALNGTGTTLKVYQISAVSGSSATGVELLSQSLVSSTEMYFNISNNNYFAWANGKSNVLMIRNEGSAPMVLTNLRANVGTVEGHISTGDTESIGDATRAITRGTEDELQMVIDSNAILAGIAGVQSINEGTFDETPVDPVDPVDPVESDIVLRGNSISLNGQIDVNFYVDVPANLLAEGVYATLDGVRADFVEGTYGTMVSKKLPAKEMNTKVTLKLYAADGTPLSFLNGSTAVTEHSYSVQDYLTYVIGNPATYGDELVKLCKAMSDYGSYTQRALDFDVDNAKAIYLADEIAAVTCEGYDYSFTANTEHISFLGASVVTESETAIRVYFALSGEGFTATVDGEPAAIQTNERGTFVEIANISAKNLGDAHTIAVTNGSETVTVSNYSAYSYVQSVLSYTGASDSLKLAVKALKLYGDLAAAYFNK